MIVDFKLSPTTTDSDTDSDRLVSRDCITIILVRLGLDDLTGPDQLGESN